jgi:hypothetical protein
LRVSFKVLAFQGQATVHAAIDTGDPRSDPRSNVFLLATIGAGPTSNPVKVRNLSVHGALLEGADLPTGTTAFLRRGSLRVAGVIAWRDRTHCGIRFQSPIDVEQWVKRIGTKEQQKIDSAIADIRGGAAGPGAPLFSSRSKQDLLASASAELLQISERIAAMPGMSIELAEELMKLDALAHSLKVAS